jgi:hypothetical protein
VNVGASIAAVRVRLGVRLASVVRLGVNVKGSGVLVIKMMFGVAVTTPGVRVGGGL